jgi:predicted MFS family arabinose efflux permease
VGLAGLTYALVDAGERGASAITAVTGAVGVAALIGFVVVERRIREPMLPMGLFSSRQFSAANAVTFVVYAALGGVFFLLVLHLQIVAGFSPLIAGTALLPITAIMLVLSGPAGALAERIGPRLPMALGPAVSAAGLLLMLRIGRDASYVLDVLPAVVVFGLGLALTVAPLTTTVLGAAEPRFAGIASGVNNAVARAASLLAVAVLPLVAGLRGRDYQAPDSFAAGFRTSVLVCAGLLALGAALAAITIRNERAKPRRTDDPEHAPRSGRHCAIGAPPLHVGDPQR